MSELTEIELLLNIIVTIAGFGLIVLVTKVYKPYKKFQADQSMKPFLLVGFFFSLAGITEIIEPYFEWGGEVHAAAMLLSGLFFTYAIYNYRKILDRFDVVNYFKSVIKLTKEKRK